VVAVCWNSDGPIYSVEKKRDETEFNYFSLQQGRRFLFDRGMLYASVFLNQIHTVDLLTRQVRVYPIEDRLLTALTYAEWNNTFEQVIWNPGFLLYASDTNELVVLAASEHSRDLTLQEIAIPFSLVESQRIPRDVYNCSLLAFKTFAFLMLLAN